MNENADGPIQKLTGYTLRDSGRPKKPMIKFCELLGTFHISRLRTLEFKARYRRPCSWVRFPNAESAYVALFTCQ